MAGCLRLGTLQQVKATQCQTIWSDVFDQMFWPGALTRQKDSIDHMDHAIGLHDIGDGDF